MPAKKRLDFGDETFEDADDVVAERHGCSRGAVLQERMRRGISHLIRIPDIDLSNETFEYDDDTLARKYTTTTLIIYRLRRRLGREQGTKRDLLMRPLTEPATTYDYVVTLNGIEVKCATAKAVRELLGLAPHEEPVAARGHSSERVAFRSVMAGKVAAPPLIPEPHVRVVESPAVAWEKTHAKNNANDEELRKSLREPASSPPKRNTHPDVPEMKVAGMLITAKRIDLGWSGPRLARELGITASTVYFLEKGQTKPSDYLCQALEVGFALPDGTIPRLSKKARDRKVIMPKGPWGHLSLVRDIVPKERSPEPPVVAVIDPKPVVAEEISPAILPASLLDVLPTIAPVPEITVRQEFAQQEQPQVVPAEEEPNEDDDLDPLPAPLSTESASVEEPTPADDVEASPVEVVQEKHEPKPDVVPPVDDDLDEGAEPSPADSAPSIRFDATPAPDVTGLDRPARQIAWARAAQAGSRQAAELLLKSIDGLIWHGIRKRAGAFNDEDRADCFAEVQFFLLRMLPQFDPSRGAYVTWAVWWIWHACSRWRDNDSKTVRVPVNLQERIVRMRKAREAFAQEHQRQPSDEELAKVTKLTLKQVQKAQVANRITSSLDAPIREDSESTLGDFIADEGRSVEDAVADDVRRERVLAEISKLSDKERFVLKQRFGIGTDDVKTLEEIGAALGITRQGAYLIEKKALEKLAWRGKLRGLR